MHSTLTVTQTSAVIKSLSKGSRQITDSVGKTPKFRQAQAVCFIGGSGTVRACQPESGSWSYLVEMDLGPEPEVGRIGSEATILLQEVDIEGVLS